MALNVQNLQSELRNRHSSTVGYNPLVGMITGAVTGIVSYPFVRLQTLAQTTTSANSALALVKEQKGYYRGAAPFILFSIGNGAVFGIPFLGPLFGAAFYPLEVAQIKLAADNAGNNQFNYKETISSMTKANAYSGVSTLIARNYLMYLGFHLSLQLGYVFMFPTILGSIALDNVRRNFVVNNFSENGNKASLAETYNGIVKSQGYKGLFKGFAYYPAVYAFSFVAGTKLFRSQPQYQI